MKQQPGSSFREWNTGVYAATSELRSRCTKKKFKKKISSHVLLVSKGKKREGRKVTAPPLMQWSFEVDTDAI